MVGVDISNLCENFVQDDCSTYSNGRDFFLLASIFMPLQCSLRAFAAFVKDTPVTFFVTALWCWNENIGQRTTNAGWYGKGKHTIISFVKALKSQIGSKRSFWSHKTCNQYLDKKKQRIYLERSAVTDTFFNSWNTGELILWSTWCWLCT